MRSLGISPFLFHTPTSHLKLFLQACLWEINKIWGQPKEAIRRVVSKLH